VRKSHRALIALATVLAACTISTGSPSEQGSGARSKGEQSPPNVLIFVTDDQRADGTLEVMPKTRALFEREGVTFSNAYATTPLCCPSRASILTGQYAHNHGVLENQAGDELDHRLTLEAKLHEAGYRTAIAGKFLQGRPISVDPEHFDKWALTGWGYYGRRFNVQGRMRVVPTYTTTFIERTSIRWLRSFERKDDRPWCLYIAPTAPHRPYVPEHKYAKASVPSWQENPASGEKNRQDKISYVRQASYSEKKRSIYERQLRTLISVDDSVKRLFKALSNLGEERHTIAFFLSDNGHMNGEHGLFGKRMPYQQSVRIPLLMRWPGHVESGSIDPRLVANIDIASTVFDGANISAGWPLDGNSLLSSDSRNYLLLEQYLNEPRPDWISLISRHDQYIEYLNDEGSPVYAEYYDLSADPWQLENLLARDPDTISSEVAAARETLRDVTNCAGDTCP
jgi:arylsulfatase A-like enzyme